jgi:hypothetical protein
VPLPAPGAAVGRRSVAAIEQGGTQVGEDYDLPEVDNLALRARRAEDGYLDRMRATYTGGVDGWIDDGLAFTRPRGFDLAAIRVPMSVWYGVQDVLGPRAHPEYLLTVILSAQRRELRGGHVLHDVDLDAVYRWLCPQ